MKLIMSDETLVRPSKDSTPASELPAASELGYQDPSEPLTAKKTARKKALPKKPASSRGEETVIQTAPEVERMAPLPPLPLEEALPLFRQGFTRLKNEIQK